MARLAYSIDTLDAREAVISVMPISRDLLVSESVQIAYSRKDSKTDFSQMFKISQRSINKGTLRVHRELQAILDEDKPTTPLQFCQSVEKRLGRQVVYDEGINRFRNITTMKDGENLYVAEGFKVEVSAPDEESAIKRITKKFMNSMISNPENAEKMSSWFKEGRPVKETKSGKTPTFINRNDLANPGEEPEEQVIKMVKKSRKRKTAK